MLKKAVFYILLLALSNSSYALTKKHCQKNEIIGIDCDYVYIIFKSELEWQTLEQYLEKGIRYKFSTRLSNDWSDDRIPSDLEGWKKFKTLARIYSTVRRSKEFPFYLLGFCESQNLLNCKPLNEKVKFYTFEKSAKIHFFVNDVKGFSFNNKGRAIIRIESSDS